MDEVAQLVQLLSCDFSMKLKIVGQKKDFIISPNLSRGWEAPDASFGDNMHNSLRAVLERSTEPYACDSSLAQGSEALDSAWSFGWSQMKKKGQDLARRLLPAWPVGAAASSSDAPPPAALKHHVEDPADAGSDTRPSTPVEGFHDQLKELGALAEWENRTPHEQGVVLNTAIELDAERTKGVDRCATGGDDPDGGGNDPNDPQATNQSSQVNR